MADVPLLTASDAHEVWAELDDGHEHENKLLAIRSGRAKTVPVRSVAEWRERFTEWHRTTYPRTAVDPHRRIAYMAALRSIGLVSGEQGGG